MRESVVVALFVLASMTPSLYAGQPVSVERLLKSPTAWDGGAIEYPDGTPEITAYRIKIAKNKPLGFHCHPVPTMAYILSGVISVEKKGGETITFRQGDTLVEVMNSLHRGTALTPSVEIIVFYAGATHIPNTLFPEDQAFKEFCKH